MMTKKNEMIKEMVLEECKKGGLSMYLKVLAFCIIYLIKIEIEKHWLFIVICALAILIFKTRFGA